MWKAIFLIFKTEEDIFFISMLLPMASIWLNITEEVSGSGGASDSIARNWLKKLKSFENPAGYIQKTEVDIWGISEQSNEHGVICVFQKSECLNFFFWESDATVEGYRCLYSSITYHFY